MTSHDAEALASAEAFLRNDADVTGVLQEVDRTHPAAPTSASVVPLEYLRAEVRHAFYEGMKHVDSSTPDRLAALDALCARITESRTWR